MKAVVFTLGCKVNECESASIIRGLEEMGYEVSDELTEADLYIVNTCAVTAEAEKKSRQMIARVSAHSEDAEIIICGCASENHPESFIGKKNVSVVAGAMNKSKILSLLNEKGLNEKGKFISDEDATYDDMPPPLRLKTRAFIKVQDGCDNFCSYCIIPYLRGRSRSRSLDSVKEEVFSCGADECVIVGIDLSSYNDGGRTLKDLLISLKDAPARIRLGSLEAGVITDEFLKTAASVKNFAPHFHLSLQSGSDYILKKMNRHYTREEYLKKCGLIYSYFPDAAITTDIIAGFPGEREEDFEKSLGIIKEARFAHVHCFPYSERSGTVAAKTMKDMPFEIKKERAKKLSLAADEESVRYRNKFIGKTARIIKEEFSDGYTQGYSANYIRVYIKGDVKGGVIDVRIKEIYKDGVIAEII